MKPNNVNAIRIPCNLKDVFKYWLRFLAPFHLLSRKEIDIASIYLEKRYELSRLNPDENFISKALMSAPVREDIIRRSGISKQFFLVLKFNLKHKKFFIDNRINPKLIPNIQENKDSLLLLIIFDYKDNNELLGNSQ